MISTNFLKFNSFHIPDFFTYKKEQKQNFYKIFKSMKLYPSENMEIDTIKNIRRDKIIESTYFYGSLTITVPVIFQDYLLSKAY